MKKLFVEMTLKIKYFLSVLLLALLWVLVQVVWIAAKVAKDRSGVDDSFAPLLLISVTIFVLLSILLWDLFQEKWFFHKVFVVLVFVWSIWMLFVAFDIIGMSFETFLGGILPDPIRISLGL